MKISRDITEIGYDDFMGWNLYTFIPCCASNINEPLTNFWLNEESYIYI